MSLSLLYKILCQFYFWLCMTFHGKWSFLKGSEVQRSRGLIIWVTFLLHPNLYLHKSLGLPMSLISCPCNQILNWQVSIYNFKFLGYWKEIIFGLNFNILFFNWKRRIKKMIYKTIISINLKLVKVREMEVLCKHILFRIFSC